MLLIGCLWLKRRLVGIMRRQVTKTASKSHFRSINHCIRFLVLLKVAADIMVQEYGRYFQMPTCCLRGGCVTGPNHSGVELHGFLSYLIKSSLEGRTYKIFGYKGKQVRDNIHSLDVAHLINEFLEAPRIGEVYNLGGGRENSISVFEAFSLIAEISGKKMNYEYVDQNRKGDHICYISDLSKAKAHYPKWQITKDLQTIFREIVATQLQRTNG
jgi:CDP-paratose 2-epimerase